MFTTYGEIAMTQAGSPATFDVTPAVVAIVLVIGSMAAVRVAAALRRSHRTPTSDITIEPAVTLREAA